MLINIWNVLTTCTSFKVSSAESTCKRRWINIKRVTTNIFFIISVLLRLISKLKWQSFGEYHVLYLKVLFCLILYRLIIFITGIRRHNIVINIQLRIWKIVYCLLLSYINSSILTISTEVWNHEKLIIHLFFRKTNCWNYLNVNTSKVNFLFRINVQ